MKKYRVLCTFEVEVELPDDCDAVFQIEENGCPGTGVVGNALYACMDECEPEGGGAICWACKLNGKNTIIGEIE